MGPLQNSLKVHNAAHRLHPGLLDYPRIRKFSRTTDAFVADIAAYLVYQTARVELRSRINFSPDPDDDVFLNTAVDGRATASQRRQEGPARAPDSRWHSDCSGGREAAERVGAKQRILGKHPDIKLKYTRFLQFDL